MGGGNIWRSEFAQSRQRQCNGGLGRWSNASGDPEACDAKSSLPGLGGRVLIGGWARAARQGSKLWEAQVEPLVGPGTSDYLGTRLSFNSDAPRSSRDTREARNLLFCESRCQVSFPFPFPIESSSPGLNSKYTRRSTPGGAELAISVSNRSYPGRLPRPAALLLKSETNATQILPTQTKYPAKPPHPALSTPGICTP